MPPGTLWRRALRRVDRRAALVIALDRSPLRLRAEDLLAEAVHLANELAYAAGIAGPLAQAAHTRRARR